MRGSSAYFLTHLPSHDVPAAAASNTSALSRRAPQDILYHLYDLVPVGGYVIFDDIGTHAVVQQAWADFCADQGFVEELIDIPAPDVNGKWMRKTKEVRVDFSKMRPYVDVYTQMQGRRLS